MSPSIYASPVDYVESSLPVNFTDALLHLFQLFGDKVALIDPDTGTELRFKDFQTRIYSIVANLLNRGYCSGKRIGAVVGNSIDFLTFVLACLKTGIVVVPINPASKQGEIERYRSECQLDCLLNETDLEDLCHSNSLSQDKNIPEGEGKLALIFFSSGTTGPPKAIYHSHRSLVPHLHQTQSMGNSEMFPRVTTEDVVHGVLPYFHFGGLMTVFVMLSAGATVILNKKWNEDQFVQILKDYKVTIINTVPPILQFLACHPKIRPMEISTLKRIYVGAAACDPNLMEKVMTRLDVEIVQLFGMTEAGLALLMTPNHSDRLDTVGIPLPGVEIRIEEGNELWVRTPTLMEGYVSSSDKFLDEDGFFDTGDLASMSSDGLFSIVGRKKDTFKVRGWQVNPWEIEETIKKLPGITDCAVIGSPHSVDGARPKAFFVGSTNPQVIMDHVNAEFISYKHLTEAVRLESLPRTASGKIMRHLLH